MDPLTERLIKAGLEPGVAPPASSAEVIPISGPDGTVQPVPALRAIFMAVDQQLLELRQIGLRLDGIHHHLAAREHERSRVHQTCPLCVAIKKAIEIAMQQAGQEVEEALGGLPDPEGDVKADLERAAEDIAAQATEESQEENE